MDIRPEFAEFEDHRILIVDDNETRRRILIQLFLNWGIHPDEAGGGAEAIRILYRSLDENSPFSIVLVEMQMSGMGGEALGRVIRAEKRFDDIKLVIMTSQAAKGDAKKISETGFSGYLTKPISQTELKDVLSAVGVRENESKSSFTATNNPVRKPVSELFRDKGYRILLVEDNSISQKVATGVLKKLGVEVDIAANGREALSRLASEVYDLVLMDCHMPVMDGYEATRRIRSGKSIDANAKIPVVAMTANAMQGDRQECLEAGMDDYISKPVNQRNLADVIMKWIPGKRSGENSDQNRIRSVIAEDEKIWDRPAMMNRFMNDDELARRIIEGFLEDLPKQIEELKDYIASGEIDSVERQAHSIKGASANVGGKVLREVSSEIEMAGSEGELAKAAEYMPELERQFWQIADLMKRSLGGRHEASSKEVEKRG